MPPDDGELSAALSHVDRPKSDAQQRDDQDSRRNAWDGFAQLAREGGRKTEQLTYQGRINPDKDNILKDHPSKYNIEQGVSRELALPPRDCLPIPDGWESNVLENERITPEDHWQDVRLLKIMVSKSAEEECPLPSLHPGTCVSIYPKNFPADVQALIEMMDWHAIADKKVVWKSRDGKPRCPRDLFPVDNATLRDILAHNLDINAIPSRTFLKQLRRHTESELEKERLLELTQEANTQEFYDYTSRPRRTILEVLEDFPGVHIPIEYALEMFPVIRPRQFTIANSLEQNKDPEAVCRYLEILVALVEYKTIIRKPRQVSSWSDSASAVE